MESNGGGVGPRPPPHEESSHEDEMKIFLKVIKTVAMTVRKSETVNGVKERFHKREGIPSNFQKIFYGGNHLKDEKTLAEYGISKACTLHLFLNTEAGININVKLPPTGRTLMLEFMNWDTIKNIKAKIHALEGILVEHQHILYKGRLLDDRKTLASCDIQQNSTLNLILSKAEMQISVCIPGKETVALDVKTWYTVWDVKSIIESITQISAYKHNLTYAGTLLDESRSLSDCKIENGSTLRVVYSPWQIFLRTHRGNTVTLEMQNSDTIDQLKERVYQKIQVPPRYQSLVYAGRSLTGEGSLADYNVQDQSTINLVLVSRSSYYSLSIFLVPYKESIHLTMLDENTINDVKVKIQEQKNIAVKKQRLFYRGKLLSDSSVSLSSAGLSLKSKLTLELTE